MPRTRTILLLLACAAWAAAQQPPPKKQQRDLKIEGLDPEPTPKARPVPRSYAVLIGISKYKNLEAKEQLYFPERDAQSLNTILISPEGGSFKAENVHMLTGPKATLANIRQEIGTWLPSQAKEGDRVLIYFAGHGFMNNGKGYLAPYDVDKSNLAATAYPMAELSATIAGKIQASSKILLTDACHSGAISPEDTESLNHTLADLTKSLFSMTASRAREVSYETPELEGGHGVFTYYVVKGLQGEADITPQDGVVTADELAEYVHGEVRRVTGGKQNPTSERANYDPEMLLAYVPAHAKPATAPPPKTGGLVFESNMDGVEVYLDDNSVGVLDKGKTLAVPGLLPGEHNVKAVKMGYEPDGPRPVMVYPGQDLTVSFKIQIPRRRPKAASDAFDKGFNYYQKKQGNEPNYRRAADYFEQALKLDPSYSQAAFYLGLTYNALFDEKKSQQYYQKAIQIDPDYLDARANYAGMLLDIGDTDQAIQHLNKVLVIDPKHAVGHTMMAQAYRLKGLYPQSIEEARKAVALAPRSAEPHMWMADSLRLSGKLDDALKEYAEYLKLSDFDSKLAGKLNYYVLGSLIGFGKKKRASQHDIWSDLRSLAYFGVCDCLRQQNEFDTAIQYCQKSLTYSTDDPFAHFALGASYMHKAIDTGSVAELDPAVKHFRQVIEINPNLDPQAGQARQNIDQIQKAYPEIK